MKALGMIYKGFIIRLGLFIRNIFPLMILILLLSPIIVKDVDLNRVLLFVTGFIGAYCLIMSIVMFLIGLSIYKNISIAFLNIITTYKYLHSDERKYVKNISIVSENCVEVEVDKCWCISLSTFGRVYLDNIIAIIIVQSLKERIGNKENLKWLITTRIDRVMFERDEQGFIDKINFQLS